jgi:hypothetical protein
MINIEQHEAAQQEIDEDRNYRKNFLTPEEKDNMDFVEKVLHELKEKQIPCFIFPQLTIIDDDAKKLDKVFQYNNLACFVKTENGSIPTKESELFLHKFNRELIYAFVTTFFQMKPEEFESISPEFFRERLTTVLNTFAVQTFEVSYGLDSVGEKIRKETE